MPATVARTANDLQQAQTALRDYVRRNRMRYTAEREEIVRAVFALEDHFRVADVARVLRRRGGKASLTTIYRNLDHLLRAGLIAEARCGRCSEEQVFEHVHRDRHHDHLTCVACGKVVEFADEGIEVLQRHVAEKHGFRLIRHTLDLRGVCPTCHRGERS
jgi:Fur family ferric uptake transcriptional regulator